MINNGKVKVCSVQGRVVLSNDVNTSQPLLVAWREGGREREGGGGGVIPSL